MLQYFRTIDLVWNNAYEKLGNVRTAQYDEKGRKLVVQVTDDGDIVDLTGVDLKLVTIDGIEVGGRNYARTSTPDDPDRWYTSSGGGTTSVQYDEEHEGFYVRKHRVRRFEGLSPGQYTISIEAKLREEGSSRYTILTGNMDRLTFFVKSSLSEEYQKFTVSFTVDENTYPDNQPKFTFYNSFYWKKLKVEKGNKATDWTPAPEDLQFPFDLIDAQRGIYELYFPKLFVDRYTGDTKVFLELTTKDFSLTSEPFYINVFEGVK